MTPYDPSPDVIEVIREPASGAVAGAYRAFGATLKGSMSIMTYCSSGGTDFCDAVSMCSGKPRRKTLQLVEGQG